MPAASLPRPRGLNREDPTYQAAVRNAVQDAPPLHPEQKAALRAIIAPAPTASTTDHSAVAS